MNNLTKLFSTSQNAEEFATGYLSYIHELMQKLDVKTIGKFIAELEESRKEKKTVFIIGNGGSASTASHMANDIGLDVFKKSGTLLPFRIHSLTDNVPVMTAIGNDNGYENLFLYQLKMHYHPGDKLIVISASGNSPNILQAVQWVKSQGGRVIGLLGFDGGALASACDLTLIAKTPQKEYGPVEDIHVIINHLVASYLICSVSQESHVL